MHGGESMPVITVLVTVRNEENTVGARIRNLQNADYPAERLQILVASDGSTDRTESIVNDLKKGDPRVCLFTTHGGGKSYTQSQAVGQAHGDIVVLSDSDTVFHSGALKYLAGPFADQLVGCATGRVELARNKNSVAESQGIYWQYEMFLRKWESSAGLLHTASGSIMAFRKHLFRPFEPIYGDDCAIPLDIVSQGYRVVHVDDAVAYDEFPSTVKGELKARTRMTLRNITCTLKRCSLLNALRHPLVSWAVISHKLLRWLTPLPYTTVRQLPL